jgi:hypothetical protein
MISIPLWNSFFYYTLSEAKLFCTYPFSDHGQILTSALSAIHGTGCITVINVCYLKIYQFYRKAGKMKRESKKDTILQSQALKVDSQKKEEEREFKVFLTTLLLIGWTLIGTFQID